MKKLILWLLLIFPLFGNAQVYFQEGMEWTVSVEGTQTPEGVQRTQYVSAQKCIDGENPVIGLFELNGHTDLEPQLRVYVKTEGDKVYFKFPDAESDEWYLMYNFGLKPGESCYVYYPWQPTDESLPQCSLMKCVDIVKDDNYGDWDVMIMEERKDENGNLSDYTSSGIWLKGLCSENGVLYNMLFEMDGMGTQLINASFQGKEIYKCGTTIIDTVKAGQKLNIKIDGPDVYVSGIEKADVALLYTDGGMLCGHYDLLPGKTAHLNLPGRGVYILKTSAGAAKILAR